MLKDVPPPVPIHSTVKNNGSLSIFTGKKRHNYCYLLKISWQTAFWENLQQLKINHVVCIWACLLVYNQFNFAAVPGNALKCFFTEDPDVHKAPKVYCQVPDSNSLFSPGIFNYNVLFHKITPHFFLYAKRNRIEHQIMLHSRAWVTDQKGKRKGKKKKTTKEIEIKHLPTARTN